MPVTDRTGDFESRMRGAIDRGLTAAGYVVANEVKRRLAGGYTSGDFVTGNVLNSVTVGAPFDLPGQGRAIAVGSNVPYALYWEIGHHNIFTRKFERVEVWAPALQAMADEASRIYASVVAAEQRAGEP